MFRIASTRSALTSTGALLCSILLSAAMPACAGEAKPAPKDDFAIPDAIDARADVSTDSLFGFTDGTDTNSEGEREFSFDTITSVGKRAVTLADGTPGGKGRFYATSQQASVQYGVTDAFNIELGAFGDLRHVRGVLDN